MTETVETLRPLLFSIAYRMLGTVSDAEDVVQEAFARYQRTLLDGTEIGSPRAFLSAVTTRLAIDQLRSARVRRESYVGQWLPEPLLTDGGRDDPALHAERADSLSMAFLLVLERLSPVERAVFLLHDVFDYGYPEIASIVGKSEANCRQLAARARRHLADSKPRFDAARRDREELAARFFAAVADGDVDQLVEMLAKDVVVYGDGGGKVPQWSRPIVGAERVAKLLANLGKGMRNLGIGMRPREVNGQPGVMVLDADGQLTNVFVLDIADGVVQTVRSVINPDKLRHLGPLADVRALRAQRGPDAVPSTEPATEPATD
ncbi:RNA polymerase sigma-70 factor [Pseudonocardia acaciae]|uniref:RNA polymerase sigma-70 factor n=1 Tax=Pseudonocardia acaciae TaxID=551276 RepID=UPI000A0773EB|nr:RNA polymerase sigma-70 factor [Pseudonocardia acaciae]